MFAMVFSHKGLVFHGRNFFLTFELLKCFFFVWEKAIFNDINITNHHPHRNVRFFWFFVRFLWRNFDVYSILSNLNVWQSQSILVTFSKCPRETNYKRCTESSGFTSQTENWFAIEWVYITQFNTHPHSKNVSVSFSHTESKHAAHSRDFHQTIAISLSHTFFY